MNGIKRSDIPECACDKVKGEWHPCPYAQEIYEDYDDNCDCCDACSYECAMDT